MAAKSSSQETARDLESQSELTCSVCLEQFKDPKVLPCCHTFCKQCLLPLAKSPKEADETDKSQAQVKPEGSNTLSCPKCRAEHELPEGGVDGFLTDFSLVHDVEVAAVMKEKEKKPYCGQCESSDPSVAYCVECEAFLCEFCSSAHKRMKLCKEHNVLPLDKITSDVLEPSSKPVNCIKHPSEDIKLYCKTCQQLICRDCTLVDHRSHDYHFANQERQCFEEALEKVVSKSQEKMEVYKKELQKIKKIEAFVQSAPDDIKKQITAAFDVRMSALQSRREALQAQVDSEYQADSKKVWAHKDFTETAIADITASLRFAKRSRKCSSDIEMISLTKQAMQYLESLNTREHKLDDSYEVVDNTASYSCSHIEQQLHTCDSVVKQRPSLQLQMSPVNSPYLGQRITFTVSLSKCSSISCQDDEVTPTVTITYGHFRKQVKEFTVTKTGEGNWTITLECICGGNHTVSVSLLRFLADPIAFTVSGEPDIGARVRHGPDGSFGAGGEGIVRSTSTRYQQQQQYRAYYGNSYLQQPTSWREVYVVWDNGSTGQYRWGTWNGDSTLQYAIELVPTTQ